MGKQTDKRKEREREIDRRKVLVVEKITMPRR